MSTYLNGTIEPWLVGGLGLLVLLSLTRTMRSWRASKRSPYFFMRRQAQRNLRANLTLTFVLVVLATGAWSYLQRPVVDNTPRFAIITNAKPVPAEEESTPESNLPEGIAVIVYDSPTTVELSALSTPEPQSPTTGTNPISPAGFGPDTLAQAPLFAEAELPAEFDQFEPEASLSPETSFTDLVFSTEIDDDYNPIAPGRVFNEGFFTVYATFFYEAMADGMEWAWVWRYNGAIVNGGNELWAYGDEGPGWIYYAPPEGFQPGEYTLEVWVNGRLFGQSSITIQSNAANR